MNIKDNQTWQEIVAEFEARHPGSPYEVIGAMAVTIQLLRIELARERKRVDELKDVKRYGTIPFSTWAG